MDLWQPPLSNHASRGEWMKDLRELERDLRGRWVEIGVITIGLVFFAVSCSVMVIA